MNGQWPQQPLPCSFSHVEPAWKAKQKQLWISVILIKVFRSWSSAALRCLFSPQKQMEYVAVNPNETQTSGSCGTTQAELNITFSGGFINFTFVKVIVAFKGKECLGLGSWDYSCLSSNLCCGKRHLIHFIPPVCKARLLLSFSRH